MSPSVKASSGAESTGAGPLSAKTSSTKPPNDRDDNRAIFIEGSTMRHVLTMTGTGAIGLVSIFLVDVVTLFYISLLGQQELAAAVGYAATLMFFNLSIAIGFSIAATAITAKALGSGDHELARCRAGASLIYTIVMALVVTLPMMIFIPELLGLLGAHGETAELAARYLTIVLPSFVLLAIGVTCGGLLRAKGDARRAMWVTLSAGGAAVVFDPIFIFGFGLGLDGAAWGVCATRVILVAVGLHGAVRIHNMIAYPSTGELVGALRTFFTIASPAVLTQIATPFGNSYVTAAISDFGDDAVAGWAIVGRIMPLAFAAIFSLSGAVGPILSQNLGAGKFTRLNHIMRDALIFAVLYCVIVWAMLAISYPYIVTAFQAEGEAAALIRFFCLFVAGSFVFNGFLYTANAAFNNLGYAIYSTLFNWGRATLGIIPFVMVGQSYGAEGILAGWGIGAIFFGIASIVTCFRVLSKLPQRETLDAPMESVPASNSPFSSGKAAMLGGSGRPNQGGINQDDLRRSASQDASTST